MNIFKILASGDGSINEPNISAFFAYLIDPYEGHGLGTKMLQRFLAPLFEKYKQEYKELLIQKEDLTKLNYEICWKANLGQKHLGH